MQSVGEKRPIVGTIKTVLHRDNAGLHKDKVTALQPKEQRIIILTLAPHGPDLAPCDFGLFPILKRRLAERKSPWIEDLPNSCFHSSVPCPHSATRMRLKRG